jgi:hypothetical protein
VVVVKIKGENAPVSLLKFDQASIELNKGNHKLVQLIVLPPVTPVTVSSSDKDILSLTLTGVNTYKLFATKEGNSLLKASTKDGKFTALCNVNVVPSNIPAPWKIDDIRDDKASANYKDGIFSIEGGGADIWGGNDQFAFLNREAGHVAYISARIISQTNTDPWAKTGLMFRESLAPNSKFVLLSVTPGNGISIQWRDSTGGICNKKDFLATGLPIFFKLSNNGKTFIAYKSTDGKQWDLLGDITLNKIFAGSCLVGMAVCSHSIYMLNLSEFDEVKIGLAEKKLDN